MIQKFTSNTKSVSKNRSNIIAIAGGNDEKEKETIDIEFTEQKAGLEYNGNAIDFKWSDVQEGFEEDNDKANFIESLQKQTDKENYTKKWMEDCLTITESYLKKRKFMKIYFEVISN